MSRGRRFDPEQKLNLKKVFAVIIAIVVIIMFIVAIKTILKQDKENQISKPVKYYSVYTNGKWGVINSEGEYVIQPTYDEMVIVPNNEKDVFICMYEVDYNTGAYKTKAIDSSGKTLFAEYDSVEAIENYDSSNQLWYEDNVLRVKKDGRYGIINYSGEVISLCEYEQLYSLKGYKNRIVTVKSNLFGLVDSKGQVLIENKCSSNDLLIQECQTQGVSLELNTVKEESQNPKNIGRWHISKDSNSSYYTDSND